jgi:hypothetical protein
MVDQYQIFASTSQPASETLGPEPDEIMRNAWAQLFSRMTEVFVTDDDKVGNVSIQAEGIARTIKHRTIKR